MKLFLSHAHDDAPIATATAALIEEVSLGLIKAWQSSGLDGVQPGRQILEQVHEALRTCEAVISIITPTSLGRPWLLYESGFIAGQTGAQIIPILFDVARTELPAPICDYVTFDGKNGSDVARLLLQLLPKVVPKPNSKQVQAAASSYCATLPPLLARRFDVQSEAAALSAVGIRLLTKADASLHIQSRLADPSVEHVTIVSYTNEVEAGTFSRYKIRGRKRIEVLKRSPLSDLNESQACNLLRIARKQSHRPWDKARASLAASAFLSEQFGGSNDVSVAEHLFDVPPIFRAFVFNRDEALIGFYELASGAPFCEGSIYKGMGDGESLLVTDRSSLGRYLLTQLQNHIALLKYRSAPPGSELAPQLQRREAANGIKAVLFDLDGVLVDSMPSYVKAWRDALALHGVRAEDWVVYMHEGRSSRDTVARLCAHAGQREPSPEIVDQIIADRDRILASLPTNNLMEGAFDLVREAYRSGLRLGVVTGSSRTGILDRLMLEFSPYLDEAIFVSGQDDIPSKPSPEPYLAACRRLGIDPTSALVIENAPLGVRSASAAGCHVVAINSGPLDSVELTASGATSIFSDCAHVAAHLGEILVVLQGLAQPLD